MKIGALSLRTGVSIRMLRYYEQEGLLNPQRTESGYRRYSDEDVRMVRGILQLNKAGLPLAAIRSLLSCVPLGIPANPLCDALKAKIREQLRQLDKQVTLLNESRQLLNSLLHETQP